MFLGGLGALIMLYVLRRFGFGSRWLRWTDLWVCHASLSVLVNGSPTSNFPMDKGLRQGVPLSPFFSTLVAKRLAKMVNQALMNGSFVGFKLNENMGFELLQFADDTIILCEPSWSNVWCVKALLRGFKLVSGLNANIFKSNLLGVNVERDFIQEASTFLCCKLSKPLLIFLVSQWVIIIGLRLLGSRWFKS